MSFAPSLIRNLGIALLFLLSINTAQANDSTIKISADPWEPWIIVDEESGDISGLSVEFTKVLFQHLKTPYELKIYPYKRCIKQMQTGERDLLLMVKKTEERLKFMEFSEVAAVDPQLIYYAADRMPEFEWKSWEDLKGYSIGVASGFNYGDFETAAKEHKLNVEPVPVDIQNIKKLLSGRLDLILLSKSTADYYLSKNPKIKPILKHATTPVSVAEFHIALSKNGTATGRLPEINAAIAEVKKDGSLNRIFNSL